MNIERENGIIIIDNQELSSLSHALALSTEFYSEETLYTNFHCVSTNGDKEEDK